MKKVSLLFVVMVMVLIGSGLVLLKRVMPEQAQTGGSPQRVYPVYDGPGTGHAFGYNIVYTIECHNVTDGQEMVIISSSAKGEEQVEIWSSFPDLVALPNGSKFQLSEAESWKMAFKVLERGT